MLACETVGRGRCFHGLGTVVTETGPQTVGRGAEWLAAARTVGRGGRAARWPSPGLLPSCHFRGAAPEILTGHSS